MMKQLQFKLEITPFSEQFRAEFKEDLRRGGLSMVDRAFKYMYVNRTSYNGVGGFSVALAKGRRICKEVSCYLAAVEGLEDLHNRLSSVVIENKDIFKILDRFVERILDMKAKWMLSGYDHPIYEVLNGRCRRFETKSPFSDSKRNEGDQNIVGCCMDSFLTVFDKNTVEFYLMDDGTNPMDEKRNYNLNGRECITNQLKKYIEHAGDRDDALNFKVDPDTIVTKRAVFDEVYNAPNVYYAAPDRVGSYFSGAMYAFRNKPLKKALEIAEIMAIPEDRGPEDYLIGLAICAGASPNYSMCIPKWNDKANEGYFSGWDYGIKPENLEKMTKWFYDKFQIITYGNWWVWKKQGITLDDRPIAARRMLEYMEKQKPAVELEWRKKNHVVLMDGSDLDDAFENGLKLDYPVAVNMFCSKDDEDMLEISIQNILSIFPKNPLEIYVMDDAANPMSAEAVERFKALSPSVVYSTTSFKRTKKMSGKESIVGMLEKFVENAKGARGCIEYQHRAEQHRLPQGHFRRVLQLEKHFACRYRQVWRFAFQRVLHL
ncbi:unnamed protein product [Cylicocyclus nassatus]|uniref:Uncharacterized protein n=1 Tax=Cylicocyclus nassatus TaxID=53992 RepID=A0AA36DR96_CYLNA|nr:unnamed protein product [Cylicocyclus nassatus]